MKIDWEAIKKAVELIDQGVTRRMDVDGATVYLVPGPGHTRTTRVDIKADGGRGTA